MDLIIIKHFWGTNVQEEGRATPSPLDPLLTRLLEFKDRLTHIILEDKSVNYTVHVDPLNRVEIENGKHSRRPVLVGHVERWMTVYLEF